MVIKSVGGWWLNGVCGANHSGTPNRYAPNITQAAETTRTQCVN